MALEFTTSYVQDATSLFHYYKKLAEGAMAQVADDRLTLVLDPEMNSIAIVVKHMAGNMRARWTGFPWVDGETPTRDRDAEFLDPPQSRAELLAMWDEGWQCVFSALEPLSDADLGRRLTIRGEAHSVMQAINRQLAHYSYHTGQIVFLAKQLTQNDWKSLTIPRGQSREFNRRVGEGQTSQR
jgi:Protein of unknown function (DUF1572)